MTATNRISLALQGGGSHGACARSSLDALAGTFDAVGVTSSIDIRGQFL